MPEVEQTPSPPRSYTVVDYHAEGTHHTLQGVSRVVLTGQRFVASPWFCALLTLVFGAMGWALTIIPDTWLHGFGCVSLIIAGAWMLVTVDEILYQHNLKIEGDTNAE